MVINNVFSAGINPLYDSMIRTYQDVFREVYVLDVPGAGNKILLGLPWPAGFRPEDAARRARQTAKEKQYPFDAGDLLARGLRQAADKNPDARVLTDKDKP